ncbi:AprI/Inh family metalloprotease inhibitor [Methylobacterium soli]|uniref:AprI/Inh family metalloprotease inhibitor n=1 Tax=Methylobacterium soli TaxID=553447 RepID=UPI001FD2531A|nr:AprI/Inh family metalloprotease inhibitor [Methylobacterium soli]
MRNPLAALVLLGWLLGWAGAALAQGPGPSPGPEAPAGPAPEAGSLPDTTAPETAPQAAPAEPFIPSLPEALSGVPGTWDLSRDGSTRRCVMTLTRESGDAGRRLRFPAGCRKALPILNAVAGWLFTDGVVRLVDKNVRPVLLFARRPDQRSLLAHAESGEAYSLVPLQIVAMRPPDPVAEEAARQAEEADAAARASASRAPSAADPDPVLAAGPAAASASPGPAPGIYALDRYREKDVCRLELGAVAAAQAPVRILAGCHDGGLEVFDPVSWRFEAGRLTLNAKRGHTVNLVPTGDGGWRRDPETGTTFVLRRVEP